MINAPDWDNIDNRLNAIQGALIAYPETGGLTQRLRSDLTGIRGDLAALRYFENPVTVTNVPAEAPPLVVAAEAPAPAPLPSVTMTNSTVTEAPTPAVLTPEAQATAAHRASGFTGNVCDQCGGVHMIRSGTCELCNDCGSTTGCS